MLRQASGSKGIQVYVPLNTAVTYEQTKSFSRAVAQALERAEPELVVSKQKKELRKGKVLVDWSQNDLLEDDRRGLLAALPRAALGVSRRFTGTRSSGLADDGDPESVASWPPRCSSGSSATATCSRRCSSSKQKLPKAPN